MRTKALNIVVMVALIAGMAGIAYAGFIELTKMTSPAIYDNVGETITHTYEIKNTGDGILPGPINVSDDQIGSPLGTPFEYVTNNTTVSIFTTVSSFDITSNPASATTLSPSQATAIPEFPTIVLPVAGVLGIMFLIARWKKADP